MAENAQPARRNPPWTRDELTLALDLYQRLDFAQNSGKLGPQSAEIMELSRTLGQLPHPRGQDTFRNPNGIYMKLGNFLRLDDAYQGVGLDAGSKLDVEVWNEFAGKRAELGQVAGAIVLNLSMPQGDANFNDDDDAEFAEGRVLLRAHLQRERSSRLRAQKLRSVVRENLPLACEVCQMTFEQMYGPIGEGFIEVHHRIALAKLDPGTRTTIRDLALLCSNCHSMAHKANLSLDDLRASLRV